jgi:hypothetical protein
MVMAATQRMEETVRATEAEILRKLMICFCPFISFFLEADAWPTLHFVHARSSPSMISS